MSAGQGDYSYVTLVAAAETARRILAQRIIAQAAERAAEDWEEWPELGEYDWDAVVCTIAEMAPWPDPKDVKVAYEMLAERAQNGSDRPS
jgi:hypothetical protein